MWRGSCSWDSISNININDTLSLHNIRLYPCALCNTQSSQIIHSWSFTSASSNSFLYTFLLILVFLTVSPLPNWPGQYSHPCLFGSSAAIIICIPPSSSLLDIGHTRGTNWPLRIRLSHHSTILNMFFGFMRFGTFLFA